MGILFSWLSPNDDYFSEDSSFSDEDEDPSSCDLPDEHAENHPIPKPPLGTDICLDSATDSDARKSLNTQAITLTLDKVMDVIEASLDVYEKVSLVYLLYDDASEALDDLTKLVRGDDDKLIYNWAIHKNLVKEKWQEKLVEAIAIIQNFEILRLLGFDQQDIKVRFSPHLSFTFMYVNKIRKALYFMCEDLDQTDVENLLRLTSSDFKKDLRFKVFKCQYLELYLLYWETIQYIKQDNLSNLCRILKQMDLLDLSESLKELVPVVANLPEVKCPFPPKTTDNKKSPSLINEILDPSWSLTRLASMESSISADNAGFVNSSNKYDIDPKNPGVCLIINQVYFYRDTDSALQSLLPPVENKLETRIGTERDKEKLEATFKQFGFRVFTRDNLIHSEITKVIEEVMKSITNESSLFVCIMSHGDEGVIYGVNSCQVPVKTIKSLMTNKNRFRLAGKPKVLILQSCQGTRCQRISLSEAEDDNVLDGPSSPQLIPPCADLFTFWATVPGYAAIRNKRTGSWFIQSLCDKMIEFGNKSHWDDICTSVVYDVTEKKAQEVAMVPNKDSTFRKLLYLPPLRS